MIMRSNNNYILFVFVILISVIGLAACSSSGLADGSSTKKDNPENLNVEFKSSSAFDGDNLELAVKTNLPKKTKFIATITGPNKYEKEVKIKVNRRGLMEKKVRNLEDGKYTVKYEAYSADEQPRKVRKLIGDNGEALKGKHVDSTGIITYKENVVLLSFKDEAEANAKKHEAIPGAMLYTKGSTDVTGMKYYFEGKIVANTRIDGKEAWLVKNKEGYVMPIIAHEVFGEGKVGDKVKVWGTLTGDGYEASKYKQDNVVGMTGSMQLIQVNINGKDKM